MGRNKPFVLITGADGGIGSSLVKGFHSEGYRVIATDIKVPSAPIVCEAFIQVDLEELAEDNIIYANNFFGEVDQILNGSPLFALINNAAIQILKPAIELTANDWRHTLNVNTVAPFLLMQALLPKLESAGGSVVNISSIHAKLSKPNFVAYSTSKAALSNLTRGMGVELGRKVRINAIAPAAVGTAMLKAGFEGKRDKFNLLGDMHPVGRIADPREVVDLALFLVSDKAQFINGAVFELDGGISARLYDPD